MLSPAQASFSGKKAFAAVIKFRRNCRGKRSDAETQRKIAMKMEAEFRER